MFWTYYISRMTQAPAVIIILWLVSITNKSCGQLTLGGFCVQAWDNSTWIRAYALYIEECLECFRVLKYDFHRDHSVCFSLARKIYYMAFYLILSIWANIYNVWWSLLHCFAILLGIMPLIVQYSFWQYFLYVFYIPSCTIFFAYVPYLSFSPCTICSERRSLIHLPCSSSYLLYSNFFFASLVARYWIGT